MTGIIHFDFDGVLYLSDDLTPLLRQCVKEMIEYGMEVDLETAVKRLMEIRKPDSNATDHFDRLCIEYLGEKDPFVVGSAINKYREKIGEYFKLIPRANSTLEELHKANVLTIVTNGEEIDQARKVIYTEFAPFFRSPGSKRIDQFFSTRDPEKEKPHSYLLDIAHQRLAQLYSSLDTSVQNAVMVGDRLDKDGLCANVKGVRFIRVLQGKYAAQTVESEFTRLAPFYPPEHHELLYRNLQPAIEVPCIGDVPLAIKELKRYALIKG